MKIILASASPRRKQILSDAGFEFTVLPIDVDESFHASMPVRDIPLYLARKKMDEAKKFTAEDSIMITADTVVIIDDEIINKPADEDDAFLMLRKLSGQMHEVISAVCLLVNDQQIEIEEKTNVYFEELNDDEIKFYLKSCQPFDKAGAYAIQEWIGMNKIAKIEGNYYNVVGFPMNKVYKILKRYIND